MSHFIAVELPLRAVGKTELCDALAKLKLDYTFENDEQVLLEASLECAPEPVDLRVQSGALQNIADFGFSWTDGRLDLICSDVDQSILERDLLPRLAQMIVATRAAQHEELDVSVRTSAGVSRVIIQKR